MAFGHCGSVCPEGLWTSALQNVRTLLAVLLALCPEGWLIGWLDRVFCSSTVCFWRNVLHINSADRQEDQTSSNTHLCDSLGRQNLERTRNGTSFHHPHTSRCCNCWERKMEGQMQFNSAIIAALQTGSKRNTHKALKNR